MKTALAIFALFFAGCSSTTQQNAGAFLSKVALMHIEAADVTQSTVTPIYSHSESLAGLKHTSDGGLQIENLKATFAIPFPVMNIPILSWNFTASAIIASKNETTLGTLINGPSALKPTGTP